ncbi:hypothetical protein Cadr_000026949 [Camelus dromedarius]|uniref:Uncharacterized protein n=1 Tax=Camelus dromedarius TaxID=9838 RepID=A0A5N4C524_CAMDR|nr:hypothetical protein Cadr_000026949 [Camelus dromedarius]
MGRTMAGPPTGQMLLLCASFVLTSVAAVVAFKTLACDGQAVLRWPRDAETALSLSFWYPPSAQHSREGQNPQACVMGTITEGRTLRWNPVRLSGENLCCGRKRRNRQKMEEWKWAALEPLDEPQEIAAQVWLASGHSSISCCGGSWGHTQPGLKDTELSPRREVRISQERMKGRWEGPECEKGACTQLAKAGGFVRTGCALAELPHLWTHEDAIIPQSTHGPAVSMATVTTRSRPELPSPLQGLEFLEGQWPITVRCQYHSPGPYDLVQSVLQDQHEGALEEGFAPFISEDLPAVQGAPVHDVGSFAARLHHRRRKGGRPRWPWPSPLRDHPAYHDVGVLGVREHAFGCVIHAEVGGPVDDDALHGDVEALVQASDCAFELPLLARLPHIGCQAGSGEIQQVDKAEGGGSGCASRDQIAGKIPPEMHVLVHAPQEDLLVLVLEGVIEGLHGEVADDIGQVAPPEGQHALLLEDEHNAVHDAFVLLVGRNLLTGMRHLQQQQLDPLDQGHVCLGDGGGNASGQEVLGEGDGLLCHGGEAGSEQVESGMEAQKPEGWAPPPCSGTALYLWRQPILDLGDTARCIWSFNPEPLCAPSPHPFTWV